MLVCDVKNCDQPATHRLDIEMHYPENPSAPVTHDICNDCAESVQHDVNSLLSDMFDHRKTQGGLT